MTASAADRLGVGDDGVDHVSEQGAEDRQGEPGPGLAEGAGPKARPANSETWVSAVLPWRTWMRNHG